jgi:hypothetical protein
LSYIPRPAPSDPAQLPGYLFQELQNLQQSLAAARSTLVLAPLYAEPSKRPEGLVAFADGTTWNPGSGAGTYQWRGGAWQPWEGGGGGGSSDHGALSGLADDDHSQYHNDTRGDARYLKLADASETIDDRVSSLLVAGDGVTLTYNDGADSLTIDCTATAAAAMGI